MQTSVEPKIAPIFACEWQNETVALGNMSRDLYVPIWSMTTKTFRNAKMIDLKQQLKRHIQCKYFFSVFHDKNWQLSVYLPVLEQSYKSFSNTDLQTFDKMECILTVLKGNKYKTKFLENNLIDKNSTIITLDIEEKTDEENEDDDIHENDSHIDPPINGYLLQSLVQQTNTNKNTKTTATINPDPLSNDKIDEIFKHIKFDNNNEHDTKIKNGIKSDLRNNFIIIEDMSDDDHDHDTNKNNKNGKHSIHGVATVETETKQNESNQENNICTGLNSSDAMTIILGGRVKSKPLDHNLNVIIGDNGNWISQYLMAFKISNSYKQTNIELENMMDIFKRYRSNCKIPTVFTKTIRRYKYKNNFVGILFGMSLSTMDLYQYSKILNDISIHPFIRIKLKLDKIYRASIIAHKILQKTNRINTDIRAKNIFLDINDSKQPINIGGNRTIKATDIKIGDWGLSAVSTGQQQEIGISDIYLGAYLNSPRDIIGQTKYNINNVCGYPLTMTGVEIIRDDKMKDIVEICCDKNMNWDQKNVALKSALTVNEFIDDNEWYSSDEAFKELKIIYLSFLDLLHANISDNEDNRKRLSQFISHDIWYGSLEIGQCYLNEIENDKTYIWSSIDDSIKTKAAMADICLRFNVQFAIKPLNGNNNGSIIPPNNNVVVIPPGPPPLLLSK